MQQTVKQTPDPDAVTRYTYYTTADGANAPVGLLKNMKDPYLVATSSTYSYGYTYDLMGRKVGASYPPGSGSATNEAWHYDTAGRIDTFTNRNAKIQTLAYDALNRPTQSSWSDSTPTVTYGYDVASRPITINNANSNITRAYFNDNLLKSETQAVAGGTSKQVTYTYDADANRGSKGVGASYRQLTYRKERGVGLRISAIVLDLIGWLGPGYAKRARELGIRSVCESRLVSPAHRFFLVKRQLGHRQSPGTVDRNSGPGKDCLLQLILD